MTNENLTMETLNKTRPTLKTMSFGLIFVVVFDTVILLFFL